MEEVSRVEEKLRHTKAEGDVLKCDAVQRVPVLLASQLMVKGKKLEGKEEKRKVVGWSTKEMDEKVNNLRVEDTEEMVSWRSLSQEEIDKCWKKMAGKWRMRCWNIRGGGQKEAENGVKICWQELSPLFREYRSAAQARHAGRFDGGGRDEAAAKNESCERYDKENQSKRKNRCQQQLVAADCEEKNVVPSRMGRYCAEMYDWLCEIKKKEE